MIRRKSARTFLADERQTPGERVHEVRKPIWMTSSGTMISIVSNVVKCKRGSRRAVKLSDIQHIGLILQDRRLVVVHVQIVGRRKECHD